MIAVVANEVVKSTVDSACWRVIAAVMLIVVVFIITSVIFILSVIRKEDVADETMDHIHIDW